MLALAPGVWAISQLVDGLELSWQPSETFERVQGRDQLEYLLIELRRLRSGRDGATPWRFRSNGADQPVRLGCGGLHNAPYRLECPSWVAGVLPTGAPGPRVRFQLRATYLHHVGPKQALAEVQAWVEENLAPRVRDAKKPVWRISRIDLAVDVAGVSFTLDDLDLFTCRARREVHGFTGELAGKKLTGFTFGKSRTRARVYNKSLQARRASEPIRETWRRAGYEEARHGEVWRVEFQVQLETLRRFKLSEGRWMPLEPEALLDHLGSIWRYFVSDWLKLRDGNAPVTRIERRPVVGWWEELAELKSFGRARTLARGQRPADEDRLLEQAVSMVAVLGRRHGATSLDEAIEKFAELARAKVDPHAFEKRLGREEAPVRTRPAAAGAARGDAPPASVGDTPDGRCRRGLASAGSGSDAALPGREAPSARARAPPARAAPAA